jgi:hypothetical protein
MNEPISIEVCKDGWTRELQLSISTDSHGYRIAGPKFNGSSTTLIKAGLDERDAREIREYLDRGFPLTESETRRAVLQEAIHQVVQLMDFANLDDPNRSGLDVALKALHVLRNGSAATPPA